ncbi:hypothetical protein DNG35_04360 [Mesonia sp. K7]|nr:hypothetical protein DNG35_04360 [Mesonia sp. K7]
MVFIQYNFLLVLVLFAFVFTHCYFKLTSKIIRERHECIVKKLEGKINLNRNYIQNRQERLANYSFLEYNLSEVLVPQNTIRIE